MDIVVSKQTVQTQIMCVMDIYFEEFSMDIYFEEFI